MNLAIIVSLLKGDALITFQLQQKIQQPLSTLPQQRTQQQQPQMLQPHHQQVISFTLIL